MSLFMTEIAVADMNASVDWYLGMICMNVLMKDSAGGFALLQKGDGGGRLALKQGPVRLGCLLHFEVIDLNAEITRLTAQGVKVSELKTSMEGYRRVVLHDPDGHEIVLFEWIRKRAGL